LFVTLYVGSGDGVSRLCSAAVLGLAASTNVLAWPASLAVAIFRYGLERRWRTSFDLTFWGLAAAFGSLGIYTTLSLLFARFDDTGTQLGNGLIIAALTDTLGFFGGAALGVSQGWVIIPAVLISGLSIITAINRKKANDPTHLLLLFL